MTDLEHYFDVIERAAMSKALERWNETLAGEAAEARERIREEFRKLQNQLREYSGWSPDQFLRYQAKHKQLQDFLAENTARHAALKRIAELESELLKAQQLAPEIRELMTGVIAEGNLCDRGEKCGCPSSVFLMKLRQLLT